MLSGIVRFIGLLPNVGTSAWKKFGRDNCSQIAAGLSYYVLFAFVPLGLVTFSLLDLVGADEAREHFVTRLATFVAADEADVSVRLSSAAIGEIETVHGSAAVVDIAVELERISDPVDGAAQRAELVPRINDGLPVSIAGIQLQASQLETRAESALASALRSYASSRGPFPLISVVLAAFAGSVIFSSYSRALNHVWNVRTLRPLVQQKAVDLAALLVTGSLLLMSIIASGAIGSVRSAVGSATETWPVQGGFVWSVLLFAMPLLISFLFCSCAYMFLPRERNRFRDIWLGAVLGAISLEVLKAGYVIYVSYFTGYDEAYGAMGGVLLWLFFVYLSSYLLLMGAEVAYVYPQVRDRAAQPESEPAGETDEQAKLSLPRMLRRALLGFFVAPKDE